jgi:MICOS complex subunit MIC60
VRQYNNTRVPPLQQAGFGKFLLILSPFAIGGGVISYAKYDKEFRQTLVKNVPGIEPVLEVFIDDVNPFADIQKKIGEYWKKIDETSSSIKSTTSSITSSVTNLFGGETKVEPAKSKLTSGNSLKIFSSISAFRSGTTEDIRLSHNN